MYLLINYTSSIIADQLYKPIIRKFGKCKVYCSVKDNIWAEVFADVQLITKYNKGFSFLLCLIHIFSEYPWKVSLKDKKCIKITNEFENILEKSRHKPNKIWVNKASEFYKRSTKSQLQDKDMEMYSTHNEGKSVLA